MTYTITETIENVADADTESLIQIVELDNEHAAADFEAEAYTKVKRFRFETGFVNVEDGVKIEVTRLLMSCSANHNHGVYYQAPRKMELWEAMFAIGETPADPSTVAPVGLSEQDQADLDSLGDTEGK